MVIYEGNSEKHIVAEDFIPQLYIKTKENLHLKLIAKAGEEISLGQGKLKVVRSFTINQIVLIFLFHCCDFHLQTKQADKTIRICGIIFCAHFETS